MLPRQIRHASAHDLGEPKKELLVDGVVESDVRTGENVDGTAIGVIRSFAVGDSDDQVVGSVGIEVSAGESVAVLVSAVRATGGVARATGSVGNWITTNAVVGTVVSEDDIKEVMELCWEAGAKPKILMCDGVVKQAISALSQSVSELRTAANDKSPAYVVAAVDIYVSDFGNLQIVPNRLMPAETAYFLDYSFWDIAYLRPFMTHDIARTGDSIAQQLIVEYGLRAKNEAANGKVTGWAPAP